MKLRRLLRNALIGATTLALTGSLVTVGGGSAAAAGTGPYSAGYETSFRLPNHTIYRPDRLPTGVRLPIVAWGNGACSADGTWFEVILTEWASHGFLVIANGRPGGFGQTDAEMLTESIDWAIAENSRRTSKYYNRIDTTKVAVMGQSCGGLETYEVGGDPRITTTVLWNSGLLSDADNAQLARLHAPIAYFTGGPSDIAYANAVDDYGRLPRSLPAFIGHYDDVGHFGTFRDANGGEYGRVGAAWLTWQLRGDAAAGALFTGPNCGLCSGTPWVVQKRNL